MQRLRMAWVAVAPVVAWAAACSAPDTSARPVSGVHASPSGGSGTSASQAIAAAGTGTGAQASSGTTGGSIVTSPSSTPMPLSAAGMLGSTTQAAAAGSGTTAGMTGVAAVGGAPSVAPPTSSNGKQPKLPSPPTDCPAIATGMITVMGQQVRLWVGPQKGPMVFYWHGTGSRAEEAISGLGPGLKEVMTQGGVVASFTTTTMMGRTTGNNVWYYGDYDMADQVLACANQQGLIDPQRIYSAGCSAGGIHTSTMAYSRSSYLAAGTPNSGGIIFKTPLQDPMHVPFQMSSHGAREKDLVRAGSAMAMLDVYFADITATNNKDLVAKGGFAINCDHGGEHCANPPALTASMWQFLKDHTFDTATSPYATGLPPSFPTYCQIVR